MKTNFVPKGNSVVSPYLVIEDVQMMLDFVKQAFGAQETSVLAMPDGTVMHAEVKIGDSVIMMGIAGPERELYKCMIHIYTADCDAVFKKAIAAGAISLQEVSDQFYGDRNGGVKDPFGNAWWISTHIEDVSEKEIERRMAELASAKESNE